MVPPDAQRRDLLVGRGQQLSTILSNLESGVPGVLLAGEMGIGKTRLAAEVAASLKAGGWQVRRATTSASTAAVPFGAVSDLLPAIPTSDLRMILEAVGQRIVDQAGGGRLLLVVDDAQHLDEASVALVHRMLVSRSVNVLFTQRSDVPLDETLTDLWKDGHVSRTWISPLSRPSQDELIGLLLGAPASKTLADNLWKRAKGNPLFVRELVVSAMERSTIVRRGSEWVVRGAIGLPERLGSLVEARLSKLDPVAAEVLEIVAVGEPVPMPVAGKAVDLDVLSDLEGRGMVRIDPEGEGKAVHTAHPLHGEILRSRMSIARATRIRRDLADVMGQVGSLSTRDVTRAVEWTLEAGDRPDASLAARAASAAMAHSDPTRAERFARAALEEKPDDPSVLRLLGSALSAQGLLEDAAETLRMAFSLSTSESDLVDAALARARHLLWMRRDPIDAAKALDDADSRTASPGARAELQAERAIIHAVLGDLEAAVAMAGQVIEAGDASDRAVLAALIQSTLARCMLGRFDGLESDLRKARHLAGRLNQLEPLAGSQLEITELMFQHYVDLDHALEAARVGHESAVEAGRPAGLWSATRGLIQADRGAAVDVVDLGRRAKSEARRYDPFNMRSMGNCLVAIGLAMAGQSSEAAEELARIGPEESLEPRTRTLHDRAKAWSAAAGSRFDEAARLAVDGAERALQAGLRTWAASLLFDAVRMGRAGHVVELLTSLAGADAPPLVEAFARTAGGATSQDASQLLDGADQLAKLGALAPAAVALERAATILRDGDPEGAERVLFRAWILREQGRAHDEPRDAPPQQLLTEREKETAALAARGGSTRTIAETLGLSTRTVDNHLARAYRKLGVHGRAELAELHRRRPE